MRSPLIISLPTKNLRRAYEFYRHGLGFALAVPGDDMPEPVLFAINPGAQLMLVPADGFSWVLAGNTVAEPGVSECIVGFAAGTKAEVKHFIEKATDAGATMAAAPSEKPWGYSGSFRDLDGHLWMVTVPKTQ
jgi:predicted lactoylglutathione lyase